MCNNPNYRPEIDGLRAVAVIGVLLYHAGFEFIPGGFVGVDVFFVISGFLITGIIADEVAKTGHFSFANFYARRIRRLLPAMLATVAATFIASCFILPPDLLKSAGGSVITTLASVSNFYFWSQSGYFDPANNLKPLLHTWSLSVEEQFYLIWPATLALTLIRAPKWALIALLAVTGLGSLWLSIANLQDQATIYYLLPFRAFELVIGACLVWTRHLKLSWFARDAMALLGLVAIAASMVLFDESTPFPSYSALLPCLGAALVIQGGRGKVVHHLLTNPLATGIGLVSYSLYLVHWPIIVLYQYTQIDPPTFQAKWGVVAASLLAAVAMYFIIETPFRRKLPIAGKKVGAIALGLAALVSVPAATAWESGWTWRLSPEILSLMDPQNASLGLPSPPNCFIYPTTRWQDLPSSCYTIDPGKDGLNILLLGDSTVSHLYEGLAGKLGDQANLYMWAGSVCPPLKSYQSPTNPACGSAMDFFFKEVLPANKYDLVIMAAQRRWEDLNAKFPETASSLEAAGTPYVLMGQGVTYRESVPNLVAKYHRLDGLDDFIKSSQFIGCDTEHGLDDLAGPDHFFSLKKLFCDGPYGKYREGNALLYRDGLHFNDLGSLYVAEALVGWLHTHGLVASIDTDWGR